MDTKLPAQTPEGRLIEAATKASGRSIRSLAANAGISDTRWRHIIKGWQPAPGGSSSPVRAPAATLARIAFALGLSAEQLDEAGRDDAVPELTRLQNEHVVTQAGTANVVSSAQGTMTVTGQGAFVDIEQIYESDMSVPEKLAAIRMVLTLRAELAAGTTETDQG